MFHLVTYDFSSFLEPIRQTNEVAITCACVLPDFSTTSQYVEIGMVFGNDLRLDHNNSVKEDSRRGIL